MEPQHGKGNPNGRGSRIQEPDPWSEFQVQGARISSIEGRLDKIEYGLERLLARPQSPQLSQSVGMVASLLFAITVIFGLAEWRVRIASSPVEIAQTHQQTLLDAWNDDRIKMRERMAVLEYQTGIKRTNP
jgi:hypothetical protein